MRRRLARQQRHEAIERGFVDWLVGVLAGTQYGRTTRHGIERRDCNTTHQSATWRSGASSSPWDRFVADSSLERNGFERSVPRKIGNGFVGSSELGPIYQRTGRAVAGLGVPIELSGGGPRSRHSQPGSGGSHHGRAVGGAAPS